MELRLTENSFVTCTWEEKKRKEDKCECCKCAFLRAAESAYPHGLHASCACCAEEPCEVELIFMTLVVIVFSPKYGSAKSVNKLI